MKDSSSASSSSCESNSSCSNASHFSSSSSSTRDYPSRKSSQSSINHHTDESLEKLLTLVKSPLMELSSADQIWKGITRKEASSRLRLQCSNQQSTTINKVTTQNSWHTSPRLNLTMGLFIPSTLSLSTVKMHAKMDSHEFPRIKAVTSSQPYMIEGDYHQYHHAITDSEYDAYMTEEPLVLDDFQESNRG